LITLFESFISHLASLTMLLSWKQQWAVVQQQLGQAIICT